MKISCLATLTVFISLSSFSQEEIGSYEIFGKKLSVSATEPKENGLYDLYIDGYSLDKSKTTAGIYLDSKKLNEFIKSLEYSTEKYKEWKSVALENDVTELVKTIDVYKSSNPKFKAYFLYYDDWKFDYSVNMTYRFKISESEGKVDYALILSTGELSSSSNEYMTCDGVALAFYSVDEINYFISLLDKQLVIDNYSKKQSNDDLFKD